MNERMESGAWDDELPDALKARLQNRFGPMADVPSDVDQAILADARRHFEQHGPAAVHPPKRRRISGWRWATIGSTVAAACVFFYSMTSQPPRQAVNVAAISDAPSPVEELSGDVDLNGRVDILDAFAMARDLRDGRSGVRDINNDGRFDQLDIDLVAREAVKL